MEKSTKKIQTTHRQRSELRASGPWKTSCTLLRSKSYNDPIDDNFPCIQIGPAPNFILNFGWRWQSPVCNVIMAFPVCSGSLACFFAGRAASSAAGPGAARFGLSGLAGASGVAVIKVAFTFFLAPPCPPMVHEGRRSTAAPSACTKSAEGRRGQASSATNPLTTRPLSRPT